MFLCIEKYLRIKSISDRRLDTVLVAERSIAMSTTIGQENYKCQALCDSNRAENDGGSRAVVARCWRIRSQTPAAYGTTDKGRAGIEKRSEHIEGGAA